MGAGDFEKMAFQGLYPALGGAPQEHSAGHIVDEELALGQVLVEGFLFLHRDICAGNEMTGGRHHTGSGGGGQGMSVAGVPNHVPTQFTHQGTVAEG